MAARKGSTGTSRGGSGKSNSKKSTSGAKTAKSTAKKTTGTAAKKTQAKSGRQTAKRGSTSGAKAEKDREALSAVRNEVGILVALALTLFGCLSVFGLCGKVGAVISGVLFGVFGILAYIVPLLFFLAVMFFVSNLGNGKAMSKLLAAVLIVPDLCGLIQLIVSPYHKGEKLGDIYAAGTGGGWLGGAVKQGLCSVFDVVGAYLILVLIFLICCVVISERSITRWLQTGTERAIDRARDDYEYRVEQNEERRIRREEEKEEQRIRSEERRKRREEENARAAERRKPHGIVTVESGAEEEPIRTTESEETRVEEAKDEEAKAEEAKVEEIKASPAADGGRHEKTDAGIGGAVDFLRADPDEEAEDSTVEWWNPHEADAPLSREAADHLERELKNLDGNAQPQAQEAYDADTEGDEESVDGPDPDDGAAFTPDSGVRRLDFMQERVSERLQTFETVTTDRQDRQDRRQAKKNTTESAQPAAEKKSAAEPARPAGEKSKAEPARPVARYEKPPITLLNTGERSERDSESELNRTAATLQETLGRFGVNVTITNVSRGPSVTRYELLPEAGTRVNRITSLADDIKLSLAATDIRIEAPIPGKSAIGIEVPNRNREMVYLRELIESNELKGNGSRIAFAAGKDIAGKVIVADIAKMPHMLIAGTTGSGKSVFTNSIIMTILFRATPDEVRLIIVDPKVVEFGIYNGIPHLLTPVVTDPKKASEALKWATAEMSRRYKLFADENVRDLKGYNKKVAREHPTDSNGEPLKKLPHIVIIIDELADLMMVAAKDVEETICRLAQLARAAGIHLIIATQRPSVDVVTGLIKANIPSRVALLVSSGTDSRTIIDMNGAEKLLGNGDMLFAPSGYAKPVRLQGAFVSDEEVRRVVDFLKNQSGAETAADEIHLPETDSAGDGDTADARAERDEFFADAGRFLIEKKRASVSLLQRKFRIGFNRAARIIDQLEEAGVVGEEVGTKPRNVLMTPEEFEEYLAAGHDPG